MNDDDNKHIRPKAVRARQAEARSVDLRPVQDAGDGYRQSLMPPPSPKPAPNPNGILRRTTKYSKPKEENGSNMDDSKLHDAAAGVENANDTPVVQDLVVEKPRPRKTHRPDGMAVQTKAVGAADFVASAGQVEGYEPRTSLSTKGNIEKQGAPKEDDVDDESGEPLIFNSLADMMAMAGTLPDPDEAAGDPVMIEAELQFSCMDSDEYQQEQQDIFLGKQDIFETDDESTANQSVDTDDDADDNLLDVLGIGGSVDSDDEEPSRPPRAFLLLWTAIAQWVTPEATAFVSALQSLERDKQNTDSPHSPTFAPSIPTRDQTDVALSRCSGLMSALRLHTARCWHLMSGPAEDLRTVETTLGDLLRRFDYSRPMPPSLDLALTRALACVLLHTVSPVVSRPLLSPASENMVVPRPCVTLGMTETEYSYLVRTSFVAFGSSPGNQS